MTSSELFVDLESLPLRSGDDKCVSWRNLDHSTVSTPELRSAEAESTGAR
jgi:hypothetical protein